MRIFTHEDCDQTGFGFSLKNKVVVLPQSVLPEDHPGQLFFCTGGRIPIPLGGRYFWFPCPPESSAGSCAAM